MAKFIVSTTSPEFAANLANNLIDNISTYTKGINQIEDTRLYERKSLKFRDLVDSIFPSMLIIDFKNIETELRKYNDIIKSLKDIIGSDYTPTEKTLKFTSKLTDSEIKLLLDSIKIAAELLNAVPISSKVLEQKLLQLSALDTNPESISPITIKKFKAIFDVPYELIDLSSGTRKVFVFPSFSILTNEMSAAIEAGTETAIEVAEATGGTISAEEREIGKLLNYGHTATGYADSKGNIRINFNSPKVVAILYDVLASAQEYGKTAREKALQMSNTFIESTKQVEEYIEIEKDFSEGFLRIFVKYGGNIVKYENATINQLRGSILEKFNLGINLSVLSKLANQFKNLGKTQLGMKIQSQLFKGRGSPSLIDYIEYSAVSKYTGKKVEPYRGTDTGKKTTKSKIKIPIVKGIFKDTAVIRKKPIPRLPQSQIGTEITNLSSLMALLNGNLYEAIKRNMGKGERKDVLNFRTGRFARSAEVVRLTMSREGMVTAFYNYMKNPYATFSDGGRQQYPKSRDPKLLISKSIREIAAKEVANRLRAVVV